jgi:hypothetical protein
MDSDMDHALAIVAGHAVSLSRTREYMAETGSTLATNTTDMGQYSVFEPQP